MAISKNMIFTTKEKKKFSSKKDIEVPVDPCQGWVTPCKYCDKRFGKWLDVSEETLAKIPTRPGIFVLALYYKNCTEVVDITINTNDIQRLAYTKIDHAKDYIIDKKTNTSSKSTILCRWMAFKETNDKDVIKLCAHWYNNGVLPKFLKSWPGLDILQNAESLRFSHYLHKWCYIKIESIWRHSKPLPTKTAEVIKGCNWTQPCEICDSYFGEWKKVTNVVAKSLAPEKSGIYMLSVCYSTTREVVKICYGKKITLNIKGSFEKHYKSHGLHLEI
ncbi:uncharacterized protein CEXT_616441 [Caerostris extrusa]|uniref:Uncharacterized protein n=1 Tax=Caerostris extrusa TaxID=172846 RepID=A0AAV4STC0_CAEEX|nr:uncharacterized protein CEXT_616441 [Caerostris extrusa]